MARTNQADTAVVAGTAAANRTAVAASRAAATVPIPQPGFRAARGRAVQVEPIKPTLKSPGTKLLKLQSDGLNSSAFKFSFQTQLAPLHRGDDEEDEDEDEAEAGTTHP